MASALNTSALLWVDYGNATNTATLTTGAGSNLAAFFGIAEDSSKVVSATLTPTASGAALTASLVASSNYNGGNGSPLCWFAVAGVQPNTQYNAAVTFNNGYEETVVVVSVHNDVNQATPGLSAIGAANSQYVSPPMASGAFTNSAGGSVLSLITTRTTPADLFVADAAATLIGQKFNGGSGGGACLAATEYYASAVTATSWNWTASSGTKPVSQSVIVINPAAGGGTGGATVNAVAANSTQSNTSSTGAATVTPAGQQATATVKTKPLAPFNGPVWAGITVPNLVVMKLDRTPVLSLSNVAVDGTAALPATSTAIIAGTTYLMAYWNADGSLRGIETVVAV